MTHPERLLRPEPLRRAEPPRWIEPLRRGDRRAVRRAALRAVFLSALALACSAPEAPPPEDEPVGGGPAAADREADLAPGTLTVIYEATETYDGLAQALAASGIFEGMADSVTSVVELPRPLEAVFAECGEANAFYTDDRVVMCYEFFDLFTAIFLERSDNPSRVLERVLGTGAFFYLHEIGHALVDQLQIPITGREEDAVDTLATLILLLGGSERALFAAIDNFAVVAWLAEQEGELPFWDEHSLDAQRLYDIACMVYGSNPEGWGILVESELLPEERAPRCPDEFAEKSQSWDALLAPHYKSE